MTGRRIEFTTLDEVHLVDQDGTWFLVASSAGRTRMVSLGVGGVDEPVAAVVTLVAEPVTHLGGQERQEVIDLLTEGRPMTDATTPTKRRKIHPLWVVAVLIVAAAAVFGIRSLMQDSTAPESESNTATRMCKQFIAEQSPETPVLPGAISTKTGAARYLVTGNVQGTSALDTTAEWEFTCTVRRVDGDTWKLENLTTK
jgi:hypothetical protein